MWTPLQLHAGLQRRAGTWRQSCCAYSLMLPCLPYKCVSGITQVPHYTTLSVQTFQILLQHVRWKCFTSSQNNAAIERITMPRHWPVLPTAARYLLHLPCVSVQSLQVHSEL